MRRLFFFWAVLAAGSLPAAQPSAPYRPASLAAELRRWQLELGNPLESRALRLPAAWEIETPERRYSISTQPLRTLLEAGRRDPSDSHVQQARAWLDMLAQQLESLESTKPADSRRARVQIQRILARREFTAARPPNAAERLRQRLAAWFRRLLARILGLMTGYPLASQFLFWIVAAGCVGLLAVWLIRWWTRDRGMAGLPRPDPAVAARTWEQWLADAHRAADAGDWRQAIHGAYWAAISRLQQSGALPADLTHTPREYLRLLPEPPARGPLAALTSGLERFWYARRAARPEDFSESLIHLETLGCKLE